MRTAAFGVLAVGLGLVMYCCGPKLPPPSAGDVVCPGQVCEHDDLGEFNCTCPE